MLHAPLLLHSTARPVDGQRLQPELKVPALRGVLKNACCRLTHLLRLQDLSYLADAPIRFADID